jgi:MFS family permease
LGIRNTQCCGEPYSRYYIIAATPLLGGWFGLLLLFQLARGWLEGVIQPVILSEQARTVGRHQQGAVVGLRQTAQRLSSILIPPIVGGIAGRFGTSQSFLIYAAFMLPLCGLLALIIRRRQRLASGDARRLIDGALVSFIAPVMASKPVAKTSASSA